ncbi:hypothetical protein JKP88DRAFT_163229 [Tribonema minus]|uniref:Uncharacterized protein n=1 Tax=Tribonema minus TaxID=303371 RepID=A0A835YZ81_9STRA|nr:hypothetical protein JKP88DRAFT_163229 [Tribonema minus]
MSWVSVVLLACLAVCVGAAAEVRDTLREQPPYPVWPDRFHAVSQQKRGEDLGIVDLYYDWPRGGNLNLIRQADGPIFDMEWGNGTSYVYTPATQKCKVVKFGVGLLPPDWLHGAQYLGRETVGLFECHKWQKGDSDAPGVPFVVYWDAVAEDAAQAQRRPVQWRFFDGMQFNVVYFTPHEAVPESVWQTPAYCFEQGEGEGGGRAEAAR